MLDDELLRVVAAKDVSPSVLLKIKFLMVAWKDVFFCVWCLLVGNGGPTPESNRVGGSACHFSKSARRGAPRAHPPVVSVTFKEPSVILLA